MLLKKHDFTAFIIQIPQAPESRAAARCPNWSGLYRLLKQASNCHPEEPKATKDIVFARLSRDASRPLSVACRVVTPQSVKSSPLASFGKRERDREWRIFQGSMTGRGTFFAGCQARRYARACFRCSVGTPRSSTSINLASHAGCAGQAGAVTRFPSTWASVIPTLTYEPPANATSGPTAG